MSEETAQVNIIEYNLLTFQRSFFVLSQGCRTCHSTCAQLTAHTNCNNCLTPA